MENASKHLADEYSRLGGRRVAVIDDNLGSSRDWEGDTPEAAKFWNASASRPYRTMKNGMLKSFLPSLNDESEEPKGK